MRHCNSPPWDGHQLTLMKLALMNQCPQETRQWVDKAINKAPPNTLRLNMSRVQDMPRQDEDIKSLLSPFPIALK